MIGNGLTSLKLSKKKDKELEGTGEPVRVEELLQANRIVGSQLFRKQFGLQAKVVALFSK